jgi:hypothetical protein
MLHGSNPLFYGNPECSACSLAAPRAGDVHLAVMFLDDSITDGQAETGALANRLGRVERVEDAAQILGRYADAVILNFLMDGAALPAQG